MKKMTTLFFSLAIASSIHQRAEARNYDLRDKAVLAQVKHQAESGYPYF